MPPGSETVGLTFKADMADLRKELAKLPGVTDKEAKAMVQSLEKQLKRTEAAAKSAAKNAGDSMSSLKQRFGGAASELVRFGRGVNQVSPALGGLATSAGAMVKGATALVSPVGLVAAGLIATAAAAGGAALAIGGTAAAMGVAVFKSDEALERLDGFRQIGSDWYPEVPDSALESIEIVNGSLDALSAIGDRLTVVVGSSVAGSFDTLASTAVGLALEATDLFENFAGGKDLLLEFGRVVVATLISTFTIPLEPLGLLAAGILALDDAVGLLPDSAQEGLETLARFGTDSTRLSLELADQAMAFTADAVAASGLGEALGDAEERGRGVIAETGRAIKASEDHADSLKGQEQAAKAAAAANERLAEIAASAQTSTLNASEKVIAGYNEQLATIDELAAKGKDAALAQQARDEVRAAMLFELAAIERETFETAMADTQTLTDQAVGLLERFVASAEAYRQKQVDAIVGGITNTLGAISSAASLAADLAADGNAKAARRLHRLAKTAGISEVAINTGVAITKALAQLGPVAGGFAVAGLIAQGAAQTAMIAAQKPPQAHMGQIGPSTRFSPDEGYSPGGTRVLPRVETVLDAAATRRLGGEEGVRDLMMGGGRDRLVAVAAPWKHLDSELDELLQRDSRTTRRLTSAERLPARTY